MSILTLSASTPTARKQHRCDLCYGPINPGDQYRRTTNIYDGDLYTWRECAPCQPLAIEMWADLHLWLEDSGLTADDAYEWCTERPDVAACRAYLTRHAHGTTRTGDAVCGACDGAKTDPTPPHATCTACDGQGHVTEEASDAT